MFIQPPLPRVRRLHTRAELDSAVARADQTFYHRIRGVCRESDAGSLDVGYQQAFECRFDAP